MSGQEQDCVMGNVNQQKITSLEKRFLSMESDIKEIKDRLLGRPSWFISIALTMLSSLVVGLVITLMKG